MLCSLYRCSVNLNAAVALLAPTPLSNAESSRPEAQPKLVRQLQPWLTGNPATRLAGNVDGSVRCQPINTLHRAFFGTDYSVCANMLSVS